MNEINGNTDNNGEIIAELTARNISSTSFIIKTAAIDELNKKIRKWISCSCCGALIYGRTRIGKTTAMEQVALNLKEHFGEEFPVLIWSQTAHISTEKNFYSSLLDALGVAYKDRSTSFMLKQRVVSELVYLGEKTPYRRVILLIDEAWVMSTKDFAWLMDLYNILYASRYDIQLLCFLFGTIELKLLKRSLIEAKRRQIVERFMVHEMEFHGLRNRADFAYCLLNLDNKEICSYTGAEPVSLKEFYFPNATEEDTFVGLTDAFFDVFNTIRMNNNIEFDEMPMMYFSETVLNILGDYGCLSDNPICFPGEREIYECMIEAGFDTSGDD